MGQHCASILMERKISRHRIQPLHQPQIPRRFALQRAATIVSGTTVRLMSSASTTVRFQQKKSNSITMPSNKSKGFTLLELATVLGIIIVLGSVTFGVLNPMEIFKAQRDGQRISDLNKLNLAFAAWLNTTTSPDMDGASFT